MSPCSRRALLKGLGLSAGALCLPPIRSARADDTTRRIIFVTTSHGNPPEGWAMPYLYAGSIDDASRFDWDSDLSALSQEDMSPILSEFYDLRSKCLVLDGVVQASAICDTPGNNHGIGGHHALSGAPVLTGSEDVSELPWRGMTVDQVIAERVMVPGRFRSLHVANMGRTNGYQTGGSYCRLGGTLIPQEGHVGDLWERLFPSEVPESSLEAQLAQGRTGVLEALDGWYDASQGRVPTTEALKLELHREHLAALKLRVESMGELECSVPDEGILDGVSSNYQEVNRVLASMLAAAFSCDLTRVVHINVSNGDLDGAFIGAPGYDLHSDLAHASAEDAFALERMIDFGRYNARIVADLARELDAIPEGEGTMLDNTLIVWTGDVGNGWHDFGPMPYLLVGGGNGMVNTGRYVHYGPSFRLPGGRDLNDTSYVGAAHNQLLVGLCHAMGLTDIEWVGQSTLLDELDVTGPLRNLL